MADISIMGCLVHETSKCSSTHYNQRNAGQNREDGIWYPHKNLFHLATYSASQNAISRTNYSMLIMVKLQPLLHYDNMGNSYHSRICPTQPCYHRRAMSSPGTHQHINNSNGYVEMLLKRLLASPT